MLSDGRILAVSYGHWEVQPGSKHPNHPGGRGKSPYLLQARFPIGDMDQWLKDEKDLLKPLPGNRTK